VPKDASSTRSAILTAAIQALQRGGVEGFTLDAIARRAGVVKGLLLYHFGSRARLLRAAAQQLQATRTTALHKALAGGVDLSALDTCWAELRRQAEDGTARAWLSVSAAGLIDRSASDGGFEGAAQDAVLDGCAAALASGVPLADVRDAYNALWLALIDVTESSAS
jgi:AcrR family transcriptional regulator